MKARMSQDDNIWHYSLEPEEVLHFAFPTDSESYNELVGVFPLPGNRTGITWVQRRQMGSQDHVGRWLAKQALTSSERLQRRVVPGI